jgi:hypothetical protein
MSDNIDRQALDDLIQNRPLKRAHLIIKDLEIPMSSMCAMIGCEEKATHNYPGEFPKYCSKHALAYMKLQPRRKCRYQGCSDFAIYSDSKHRTLNGVYCPVHKPAFGYVTVVRRPCIHCQKLMPALVKKLCGTCSRSKQ